MNCPTQTEAQQLALDFLLREWQLSDRQREWFVVLNSRLIDESWYIVELGVEGLPDKWAIQVYDTGECDPCYTFVSPLKGRSPAVDLEEFPDLIAKVVATERCSH